jgi:hypothetical protein
MKKGRLTKEPNLLKHSIDWERFSSADGMWIKVNAYLDAHDMRTFVGLVELDNYRGYKLKFNFNTIEEAFNWAESQVSYRTGKLIEKRTVEKKR